MLTSFRIGPLALLAACTPAAAPAAAGTNGMATATPGAAAIAPAITPGGSGAVAMPVQLSPTFAREAVDHVVTYTSWRGWGPRDGDRATVARHGALVRLETRYLATRRRNEAEGELSFANIATGASMSVSRDAQGALAGASLWQGRREADLPAWRRRRLVRTGETERIIGERCRVWRAEPDTEGGPVYTACLTADGVVLRDTVLYRRGNVMSERLALSVERRPVAAAEVLPPRGVLDWAHWARPGTPGRENYALTLATRGNPGGTALQRVFTADGIAKAEEQQEGGALLSYAVSAPGVSLGYHAREPQLSISRLTGTAGPGPGSGFESAPLAGRAPLRLLGETCRWFDAAVNVSDYGRIECRTADSLPLVIEEFSRGSSRGRWEAVSLTRGRTSPGSVRPPARLLSWTLWGWPMLEGN